MLCTVAVQLLCKILYDYSSILGVSLLVESPALWRDMKRYIGVQE